MASYIINSNEYDGHHEVHNADVHCNSDTYPASENQILLGNFSSCGDAVDNAEARFPSWDVDGCAYCTTCHSK